MTKKQRAAAELHKDVPPGWYYHSIRENPLQRYWHKRRFEEISKLTEPVKNKVLDIGSADGTFSKIILDNTQADELIGVDVLSTSVDWANNHWRRNKRLKFMVADAHKLPFKDQSFDAVFILEALEHVYDPKKVLQETKRVLKKGGYAVLLVPSDNLLFRIIWFLWGFYRGKIWHDCHIQTYRSNYLPKLVKGVGFKLEQEKKFILEMLHAVKVRK